MSELINCKSCNKRISEEAKTCPDCGAPTASKNARIVWGILGVLSIIIVLFHCELGIPFTIPEALGGGRCT